jgi:hypothetical protein
MPAAARTYGFVIEPETDMRDALAEFEYRIAVCGDPATARRLSAQLLRLEKDLMRVHDAAARRMEALR